MKKKCALFDRIPADAAAKPAQEYCKILANETIHGFWLEWLRERVH